MLSKDDLEAFGYFDGFEEQVDHDMTMMYGNPMDLVEEFITKSGQDPNPQLYYDLITEEFEEFRYVEHEEFETQEQEDAAELKELADLVYVIFGFAYAMDWDLMEALRRVHESNLGRMIQPDGSIKRREDGKILKNRDFPKVDLEDLV